MSSKITIKKARGITTLEIMVVASIITLLVMVAAPSLSRMMNKQRLTSVCHEVYAQLTYARSLSVKINQNVSVSFKATRFYFDQNNDGLKEAYSGCIGLNDARVKGCNCAGEAAEVAQCTVNGRMEVVRFPAESNVFISGATFAGKDKATFSARDGTVLAGNVSVGSEEWACKVTVSTTGRVRFSQTSEGQFIVPSAQKTRLQ